MNEILKTRCCVVGGGPAGLMSGFLLARAGVDVLVLEKHADFFRDFRGDTIHPSTLELLAELGLLDEFLRLPHQEVRAIQALVGNESFPVADFSHLPTRSKFIAFLPQWDFLNFLAAHAKRLPGFQLRMEAEVTGLCLSGDKISGVTAKTPSGELHVEAGLVLGADGRGSVVRQCAQLPILDLGAPIDVLWFRLSKKPADPGQSLGRIAPGHFLVMLDRGDYWQCGFVIAKGAYAQIQAAGLEAFQRMLAEVAPFVDTRTAELDAWEKVRLLSVRVDRLKKWCRPGLLCIGDAAHAMSPVGGVGINLAIQDAVAVANLLSAALRSGEPSLEALERVQQRREWPTRMTQSMQVFIHNRVLRPLFATRGPIAPPWPLRLLRQVPFFQRIPARLIGLGFRPEHLAR